MWTISFFHMEPTMKSLVAVSLRYHETLIVVAVAQREASLECSIMRFELLGHTFSWLCAESDLTLTSPWQVRLDWWNLWMRRRGFGATGVVVRPGSGRGGAVGPRTTFSRRTHRGQ
ncbi:hypothetical protein MYCSP_04390 [Mycobacteroides saopaulense]|nr:hypothetical protein MYCSP_04390 [Mycobacteroides saopaulense]